MHRRDPPCRKVNPEPPSGQRTGLFICSLLRCKMVDAVQLFINENDEICRSNVSFFFVGAPPKGLCASQPAAMQSQRLSLCRNPMYAAAGGSLFGPTETFFCHQAPSKIVDQVMIARHGLSQREATPIDPPHPLSVHCSQSQLAGLRAKRLQQGGLDLAGREIDPWYTK